MADKSWTGVESCGGTLPAWWWRHCPSGAEPRGHTPGPGCHSGTGSRSPPSGYPTATNKKQNIYIYITEQINFNSRNASKERKRQKRLSVDGELNLICSKLLTGTEKMQTMYNRWKSIRLTELWIIH